MVKSIDVVYKRWFDKVNGNSYFGGFIVINYGYDSEQVLKMPFEYGYGSYPVQRAFEILRDFYGWEKEKFYSPIWEKNRRIKLQNGEEVLYRDIDLGYGKKKDLIEYLKYPNRCFSA